MFDETHSTRKVQISGTIICSCEHAMYQEMVNRVVVIYCVNISCPLARVVYEVKPLTVDVMERIDIVR